MAVRGKHERDIEPFANSVAFALIEPVSRRQAEIPPASLVLLCYHAFGQRASNLRQQRPSVVSGELRDRALAAGAEPVENQAIQTQGAFRAD
jgi:hypothetical protein